MKDQCVICKEYKETGITLSRCCCDSDFICSDCATSVSLATYLRAVTYKPENFYSWLCGDNNADTQE
jgi:hypothetical protein